MQKKQKQTKETKGFHISVFAKRCACGHSPSGEHLLDENNPRRLRHFSSCSWLSSVEL